jgi:predicted phosphoribosyltransferase
VLAGIIVETITPSCEIVAIDPGGVAIARAIAGHHALHWRSLQVVPLVAAEPPGALFGAVTANGAVVLDHLKATRLGLSASDVERATEVALRRVRAGAAVADDLPMASLARRVVVLVDDGTSASAVVRAAVAGLRLAAVARLIRAVPIGHRRDVWRLARYTDVTYCARLHTSAGFVAAQAYEPAVPLVPTLASRA